MTDDTSVFRRDVARQLREAAALVEAGQITECSVRVDNDLGDVEGPYYDRRLMWTGQQTVTIALRANANVMSALPPSAGRRRPTLPQKHSE